MTRERPKLQLVAHAPRRAAERPNYELDWSIMMARAQSGDRDAYRRLLTAVTPFVRARALLRLGTPEEAEDAVQDTLLTMHQARQSYDPARPFGPWLAAIADRRVADRVRRIQRGRKLRDAATDVVAQAPVRQDKVVLDSRALEAALAELSPEQARAIRLLKLEERSLAEASASTGQSIGALKGATHRALKALRERLFEGPRP